MYNEKTGAEACVRRICTVLETVPGTAKLVTVDDGSQDGTGAILDRLAGEFPSLTVIHHEKNSGYGAALRTGMRHAAEAGFEYALFMDSDLTNDPADIPRFFERMRKGYDVIKATRYSGGGGVSGVPAYRVIISRVGNSLARRLYRLPVTDCTNGFRAVRTALLAQMNLTEQKFPIIMEELYLCKLLAKSYAQVPVTLTNRQGKQRPTSFVYRPRVFYQYLKYPLRSFFGLRPQETDKEKEKR
jgi:glycosyltransferase involved in cell wall biosynthesis